MGLFICVILGAFIGWLIAAVEEVDEGVLSRMGIGLFGGIIGSLAAAVFDGKAAMGKFTLVSALLTIAATIVLLVIARKTAAYEPRDSDTAL